MPHEMKIKKVGPALRQGKVDFSFGGRPFGTKAKPGGQPRRAVKSPKRPAGRFAMSMASPFQPSQDPKTGSFLFLKERGRKRKIQGQVRAAPAEKSGSLFNPPEIRPLPITSPAPALFACRSPPEYAMPLKKKGMADPLPRTPFTPNDHRFPCSRSCASLTTFRTNSPAGRERLSDADWPAQRDMRSGFPRRAASLRISFVRAF